MPQFRIVALFAILTAFAVSGCESVDRGFSHGTPQMVAAPDSVSAMLADAADRAANALETLSSVEAARTPGTETAPVGNAPPELRRAMTVNWVGPIEQITKTLADRAGYTFETSGSPPPVPIVISIDAENKPVIDILRDVGLQLGVRGDVRVDSNRHTVEIKYPANTGAGRAF